jgi:hypothetical protein
VTWAHDSPGAVGAGAAAPSAGAAGLRQRMERAVLDNGGAAAWGGRSATAPASPPVTPPSGPGQWIRVPAAVAGRLQSSAPSDALAGVTAAPPATAARRSTLPKSGHDSSARRLESPGMDMPAGGPAAASDAGRELALSTALVPPTPPRNLTMAAKLAVVDCVPLAATSTEAASAVPLAGNARIVADQATTMPGGACDGPGPGPPHASVALLRAARHRLVYLLNYGGNSPDSSPQP